MKFVPTATKITQNQQNEDNFFKKNLYLILDRIGSANRSTELGIQRSIFITKKGSFSFYPTNENETLLLEIVKLLQEVGKNVHTKAQETLEFKNSTKTKLHV